MVERILSKGKLGRERGAQYMARVEKEMLHEDYSPHGVTVHHNGKKTEIGMTSATEKAEERQPSRRS